MAEPVFQVSPSALEVPAGVPLGAYRRTIHPFENWTLFCDDNLAEKIRLCDIRQEIEIKGAGVIFSWALSATENGAPMMKIVAPAGIGKNGRVRLTFTDGSYYEATMASCNQSTCETYTPAGPKTQQHIEEELPISISFNVPPVGQLSFKAPMKGLKNALRFAQ